jgi:NSS family neurotransmitter:Na+ symporter
MIAYSSYLPAKTDITRNAILTSLINSGYSLFAGFAVFAVLGFMALSEGVPISEVVKQSIGLAFVAYPKAVSLMPGGNFFGAIFFLCLVVAGISSSISIIEAFTAAVVDKFGWERRNVVNVTCVLGFLGSVVFTTQAGLYWLDIADHFLTHYGLVVVGIVECVIVAWFFRFKVLRNHINRVSSIKLGAWWTVLIKYFVPIVLAVILVGDLAKEVREPYEGYPWAAIILIGVDWVLLTLLAAVWLAMRPWRTEEHRAGGRGEEH